MGRFDGRVALVTGAASGIGRTTATVLARDGATVVVADRETDAGEVVVAELHDLGARASLCEVDVANEDSVRAMVAHAVETHGGLDLAVNNAGLRGSPPKPLEDVETEHFDRLIAVNLRGVFLCLREEVRHMVANGGGAIVNTASGTG